MPGYISKCADPQTDFARGQLLDDLEQSQTNLGRSVPKLEHRPAHFTAEMLFPKLEL